MAIVSENNGLVLVKREITEGTDPVPVPSINAVTVFNSGPPSVTAQTVARRFLTGDLSRYATRIGRKLTTVSLSLDLSGAGTAGIQPRWLPLLRMAGLQYAIGGGTTTDINAPATYKWLASGSGTGEFYLDLLAGGDPGLNEPSHVTIGSTPTERNRGALGALAAGEWGYGDNDTLGYSTVYVRLDDDTDPDSKATGWVNHVLGTSIILTPRSSAFESATIYDYLSDSVAGLRHVMTNCFANWTMTFDPNGVATLQVDVQSLYNTPTDLAIPAGAVFDTPLPPLANAMLADFDGAWSPTVPALTITGGVEVVERPDLNAADGLKGLAIVAREVSGTITVEQEDRSVYDLWAKWAAGTEADLDFTLGSSAGNIFNFDFPKVQFDVPRHGSLNQYRTYELPFFANRTSGDDEVSITLT